MTIEKQYDDAEFALFLQGEEALSRNLKELPQAGPPPALDAAILATIAAALAQEKANDRIVPAQAQAANDPVVPKNDSTVPVGSWLRSKNKPFWKISTGIAAGVMMTILFKSVWIPSDNGRVKTALLNDPSLSVSFHAPAPAPAPDMTMPAARMQPTVNPVPAPVLPAMEIESPKPVAVVPPAASAVTVPAMPAPIATTAPPAQSDRVARVEITGMAYKRADKQSAQPVPVTTAEDIGKAAYSNTSDDEFSSDLEKAWTWDPARGMEADKAKRARAAIVSAPAPVAATPILAAAAAEPGAGGAPANAVKSALAGSVDKKIELRADVSQMDQAANAWIVLIEEQLKEKSNDKALEQWAAFRKEFPNYAVPEDLVKQIKVLEDSAPKK